MLANPDPAGLAGQPRRANNLEQVIRRSERRIALTRYAPYEIEPEGRAGSRASSLLQEPHHRRFS